MKGTKMQKGITLIALIITIIVLLVLAVVAIAAVQDSGLLIHVDRSAIMHEVGVISEKIRLESQALKLAGASSDNAVAQTGGNALKSLYEKYDSNNADLEIVNIKNATSIPEGINDGNYFLVIPEKLNYDISRGKGYLDIPRTKDIFVVDEDFNVYYILDNEIDSVIFPPIGGEVRYSTGGSTS